MLNDLNNWTISVLPLISANWHAVRPSFKGIEFYYTENKHKIILTLSCIFIFKPAKQRNRAIPIWAWRAAKCNGVASALFLTSIRQPNEVNASTTDRRPSRLA